MTTIKEYAQEYNKLSDDNGYTQIPLIKNEWKVLRDSKEINKYLPTENHVTFTMGIKNKKLNRLHNFESVDLSQAIPDKRGHILNTGGSIWAIEFVPKKASLHHDHAQYLAIGGYNSINDHYTFTDNPCVPNAIQIWKCTSDPNATVEPRLDMCILHNFGVVVDFKWCPYSVYDTKDKLGILAVLFGNGEIKVFVVPHPQLVRNQENMSMEEIIYINVETARLELRLPRTYNTCFAWGGRKKLVCGTKLGNIVVWNILESLLTKTPTLIVNILTASSSAILSIAWLSLFDEYTFFSSDSDGTVYLHDLNDPFMITKIFRVRCTYICVAGAGYSPQFLFGDNDGITRLNTTYQNKRSITLTMHNGLIWSISTSPFHGIVAASSSNGTVMIKPFWSDKYKINPKHKLKILEYTLYKLTYDENSKTYTYIDGFKPKTDLLDRIYHEILIDPIVSIHKVAWNNNSNACGWVASGGKAGLCRLEFTGCN